MRRATQGRACRRLKSRCFRVGFRASNGGARRLAPDGSIVGISTVGERRSATAGSIVGISIAGGRGLVTVGAIVGISIVGERRLATVGSIVGILGVWASITGVGAQQGGRRGWQHAPARPFPPLHMPEAGVRRTPARAPKPSPSRSVP